ncbi:MAG: zinc ribbon domain-containing protein [Verrucomicrobia bacterium]|nr:MAG: zinc ribbon domain-containing protein [Verrucomicrobiota bacterium]
MAEVIALRKHPCPDCGGDAEWNAAKQALACPYCGLILPWTPAQNALGASILEHPLDAALAKMPNQARGLLLETKSVRCESCQAISQFDPTRAAQRCDFCGSPAIVAVDDLRDAITPESLLPAVVSANHVRDDLRKWYGQRWFAPNKLKRVALTDTVSGIYLPYWTFDAHAAAQWTAEAGHYYYENQTVRDSNGRSATRRVRKVRWEPAAGSLEHFFDDDLVSGSCGVHADLLKKVEPFPTTEDLKAYDPAYVRGWVVERYQVDLNRASQISEEQMEQIVRQLCSQKVPGDTQRNLQVQSHFSGRTFKHILVPVWLVSYNYGAKNFQVVVNGYTGKIAGEHPLSWVKISLAIIAALILVLVIFSLRQ